MHAGASDYKCTVDLGLLDYAESEYGISLPYCTPEFKEYADRLIENYSIPPPKTTNEALQLFFLILADTSVLRVQALTTINLFRNVQVGVD